jgi:hypothetical protein
MGGDPDVELLKTELERFLEAAEKLAVFRAVRHIDKKPGEVILIDDPHAPRRVWVSHEAAPKCARSSVNVVASSASGTA